MAKPTGRWWKFAQSFCCKYTRSAVSCFLRDVRWVLCDQLSAARMLPEGRCQEAPKAPGHGTLQKMATWMATSLCKNDDVRWFIDVIRLRLFVHLPLAVTADVGWEDLSWTSNDFNFKAAEAACGSFVYHTLGVRNFNILNLNPSSLDSSSEILHLEFINSAEWVKIIMNLKLQSALCHHVWQFSVRISMPSTANSPKWLLSPTNSL